MAKKFARWSFTNFNLDYDYSILTNQCTYLIVGLETCPTTGKNHHQCYVEFEFQRYFNGIKKLLPGAHIEHSKGGAEANKKYCSKDNNIVIEYGEMKQQGKRHELGGLIETIKTNPNMSTKELIEAGEATWARNYRALEIVKSEFEEKRNWETECIYIFGESGSGKTRMCIENGAKKVWFKDGFYRGYDGSDVVLFDDVDEWTFFKYRNELLELMDRYEYSINVKGGSRNWKPRKIYFTSNFPLEQSIGKAPNGGMDAAVKRRISKIVHLTLAH